MDPLALNRLELTRYPWLKSLLRSRWPLLILRGITLTGFIFTILAGLVGSPVGSSNFAIIFVWIAWWSVLKLVLIPFGGRSWCAICPIPMPGEWLQQGALLGPAGKGLGWSKRWPKKLNGAWLQVGLFGMMGMFSAVILTQPRVTAWVLLGLILLAVGLSLVFERRSFCRYLCPIGGFTGLYSRLAPVELRVKDASVCATHTVKTCYTGSAEGYGCPWGNFPAALKENTNCGLCMECLRSCPHDNFAVNLRPFGADLDKPARGKLDEAFFGLVMLASALLYTAVFLGPWGALKNAAGGIGSTAWFLYATAFLAFILGLVPGAFAAAVRIGLKLSRSAEPLKKAIADQSLALLPLGLAAWIAFTLSFALAKVSYILPVLSDPFGWGWNLLGTAHLEWSPDLTALSPFLQGAVLLVGLTASIRQALRHFGDGDPAAGKRQALPFAIFCLAFTLALLWLLIG